MADRKIDFEYIKQQIDTDQIISIMDSLGVPFVKQDNKQLIFYSICHHPNDFLQHKPKLYYYIQSKSMFCYVCGFNGDIFSLVQQVLNYDNVVQAVEYVCNICKIDISTCRVKPNIDQWQSMKKFLPNYEQGKQELVVYDKNVLNLFKPFAHVSWLNDGISKQAMAKFNIGWYARNEQITLPVLDINGDLVGIHARNTRQQLVDKGLKYQPLKTLNDEYKFPTGQVLYGLYQNQEAIKSSHSVILFEAPKSCLQMQDILGDDNISCAMFGWNFNKVRRDILLDIGVKTVTIALDKQYQSQDDKEFDIYVNQVKKIARLFSPYCIVYVIYDRHRLLEYKDSPSDKGSEVWWRLWKDKVKIK